MTATSDTTATAALGPPGVTTEAHRPTVAHVRVEIAARDPVATVAHVQVEIAARDPVATVSTPSGAPVRKVAAVPTAARDMRAARAPSRV